MISRVFATPINTASLMLILAILLAALPGSAQQLGKSRRSAGSISVRRTVHSLDGFRQDRRELGYVQGVTSRSLFFAAGGSRAPLPFLQANPEESCPARADRLNAATS